jgi:hypothetical protein
VAQLIIQNGGEFSDQGKVAQYKYHIGG